MSAYVVSPDTIDLIASAAERLNTTIHGLERCVRRDADYASLIGRTCADKIGAILHAENVHSVNYRYNETNGSVYRFRHVDLDSLCGGRDLTWEKIVLGSIRCLRYQSCEAPDYAQSAGARILEAIEADVVRRLTSEAPWGWTRQWTAEKRAAYRATVERLSPCRA